MESPDLIVMEVTEGDLDELLRIIQDFHSYACKEPHAGEPGSPTTAEVLPQIEVQNKIIQAFAGRINGRSDRLEKMIKSISDEFQHISEALKSFHQQALLLQTDNEKLTRENVGLRQKMSELEVQRSKQEAFSRGFHLSLHGVAEDSSEDVGEKVREVCKALVPEEERDRVAAEVDGAHRLGLLKAGGDPRPIIIRFASRASRDLTWKHAQQSDFLLSHGFRFEEDVRDDAVGRRGWLAVEMAREQGFPNQNISQEERDQEEPEPPQIQKELGQGDGNPTVCKVCGETCPDNGALLVHMADHVSEKKFLCFICGKLLRSNLNKHLKDHFKPHVCDICGKTLHSSSRLKLHRKIHTGEPYRCEICGLGLLQRCSLLNHMRIHTGERPFPCPTCGKRFHSSSRLSQHKRNHSDIKPHGCGFCKKRFRDRQILVQHQKIHSSERQRRKGHPNVTEENLYPCDVCGKRFSQKPYVLIHMRIHTGEKPFVCSQCGTGFSQKGSLTRHMETHRRNPQNDSYSCGTCGKSFSKVGGLNLHSRIHKKKK